MPILVDATFLLGSKCSRNDLRFLEAFGTDVESSLGSLCACPTYYHYSSTFPKTTQLKILEYRCPRAPLPHPMCPYLTPPSTVARSPSPLPPHSGPRSETIGHKSVISVINRIDKWFMAHLKGLTMETWDCTL